MAQLEKIENTVLVVDDNPESISVLSLILKEEGHYVHTAVNGRQAVESVKADAPDLILMDIKMPEMDGFEACRIIKKNPKLIFIPVIFISAINDTLNKIEAFKAGGIDFISKPFQVEEVKARVSIHLKLYEYQRELQNANTELFLCFQNTFEQVAVGIFHAELNGEIIKVNKQFCFITGYKERELLGNPIFELLCPDFRENEKESINKLLNGIGQFYTNEFILCHEDGQKKWGRVTISLILTVSGNPDYLLGILEDISERKKTEENLILSEKKFRDISENIADWIWEIDEKGLYTYVSDKVREILGYEPDELLGKSPIELIIPEEVDRIQNLIIELINANKPIKNLENWNLHRNGRKVCLLTNGIPIYDEGRFMGYRGIDQDITERKIAEEKIRELNQDLEKRVEERTADIRNLSQALEQSPASVIMTDKSGIIVYVNKTFTKVTGYSPKEAIGQNPSLLKSGETKEKTYKKLWETILEGKTWRGEIHNKRKNGELFWEYASVSPILDKENHIKSFVAVKEDITERKKQEHGLKIKAKRMTLHSEVIMELTQQEELTVSELEEAFKVIIKATAKGLEVSRSSIWKYNDQRDSLDCQILYDTDTGEFSSGVKLLFHDYPRYFEALSQNLSVISNNARTDLRTRELSDSYLVPLNINSMLDIPIWLRGSVYGIICNEHRKTERHWEYDEESFARSIADIISLTIESDARKKAQEGAEAATRAKSDFLANMSHEIRTPMNAVIGLTHLLTRTELEEKQLEYVQKIDKSAKNLLGIINDILDFSKIEAGKLDIDNVEFNLEEVLENIISIISVKTKQKGIELNMDIDCDIPPILLGDPLRLGQILINLLNNSLKFTEKGEIKVKCEVYRYEQQDVILKFTVSDTGIGMTEEQKNRIFSAFSQADTSITRKYGGTGLGLSISKKLTEMMGGNIIVESENQKGSTFQFTIKCKALPENMKNTIPAKETKELMIDQDKISARILLVEDNEINQLVAIEILESKGFTVDLAENGKEAVEMVENRSYNLVLMDLQMPVMDGITAAGIIRNNKNYDSLPIIAMTADAMTGVKDSVLNSGMNDYITKPIDPENLFRVLIKWLHIKDIKEVDSRPSDEISEISSIPQISFINTQKGIKRINGNLKSYIRLIKKFRRNNKSIISKINKLISHEDFKGCEHIVHSIKGISGNISADSLFKVSTELDNALLQEDKKNISLLLKEFEIEMKKVLHSIEVFEEKESNTIKPEITGTVINTKINFTEITPTINTLKTYLSENNMRALNLLNNLQTAVIGTKWSYALEEINILLEDFDFEKSLELLNTLDFEKDE